MTAIEQSSVRPPKASLNVVLLSDTHELHRRVSVPDGDILIHAGDFTLMSRSIAALRDFNKWLGELPHRCKVICPGNHDYLLEDPSWRHLITNATLLINEGTEVMGWKIWGSPTTPLYGGAFGLSAEADRVRLYSQIPPGTDILITHGPPQGILDKGFDSGTPVGCPQLLEAILRIKPRLHVFGHAHGAYGMLETAETLFVNASLMGVDGTPAYPPIVVNLSPNCERSGQLSSWPIRHS